MTCMMLSKIGMVPLLLLLVWVYRTSGEVIKPKTCGGGRGNKNCTIGEVQITPCIEAKKDNPCKIKVGKSAAIQFHFKTVPNLSDLEAFVFWIRPSGVPLPWIGFDIHACKYTTCPTTGGQQTYKYSILTDPLYPKGTFPIEWILKKEDVMECCFKAEIQLVE